VDNLTARHTAGLPGAAGIYLAAVAAVQVLTAGYGYLSATVAQRALAALRTHLFAHLLALPTDYHDRTPVGDAIARATADVETIDDLFSSSVATLLGESVRLATVAAAMLVLSPPLTLAAAVVIPPLAVLNPVPAPTHPRRRTHDPHRRRYGHHTPAGRPRRCRGHPRVRPPDPVRRAFPYDAARLAARHEHIHPLQRLLRTGAGRTVRGGHRRPALARRRRRGPGHRGQHRHPHRVRAALRPVLHPR